MSTSYEGIVRKARQSQIVGPQSMGEEAKLIKLRFHVLSLLERYHVVGKVSEPETFSVRRGIGCAARFSDKSSVVAHFVEPVTTDNAPGILVWNSGDHVSPKGDPVAWGPSCGIEDTDATNLTNQGDLLGFIAKWIESGKPGTWKPLN
jgi:hypothetical protein